MERQVTPTKGKRFWMAPSGAPFGMASVTSSGGIHLRTHAAAWNMETHVFSVWIHPRDVKSFALWLHGLEEERGALVTD